MFVSIVAFDADRGEPVFLDDAELNARLLLDLLLEVGGEFLVALGGDDGQGVDVEPPDAVAGLVDAQP